ncbi:MAG: efflux RND transporter periplasmic adaptor subunit [Gemmatimonadota bacterium]
MLWSTGVVVTAVGAWLLARSLQPPTVSVTSVTRQDVVRTLVLVGRVRAPSRARLGSSLSGTVREVRVREGDRVEGGEALVLLDDRETRAQVAEAEAALTEITASVRSEVEQAEQEATLAQRDLERIRSVAEEGGLTRQEVERAEQRAADARSRLDAARAQGEGSEIAALLRARAALEAARARHALTRVLAPADGTVLLRSVEPGDAVQPGRALLELALDGPTEIVVFPAEENLAQIRTGARAVASADAYPAETFAAEVSLIAPSVDPATGTVEVRLRVPEPPPYLLPDMTLSVNVEAGRRTDAAVLPEEAVRGLGTPTPWVAVVRDGRLERRPVEIGLRSDSWVEIVNGLDDGEAVVATPDAPEPGTRVRLAPVPEA